MVRVALALLALMTAWSVATVAHAGLDDGLNALRKGDYATAAKVLGPLADRGDAEAQFRVGLMYEYGKGYPQDKQRGIAWFRRSANQGHTAAQQELGVIYSTGDGVAKDDAEAAKWFRKAAELGNPTAQYNLGVLYAKGAGVPEDYAQAYVWIGKSAAQGMSLAQSKLGIAYETGEGVKPDPVIAYADYAIAARGGNADYAAWRDEIAKKLSTAQKRQGQAMADAWTPGQPMPGMSLAAGVAGSASAKAAPVKDRCTASGSMGGEKFTATHCTISLYGDQHSVAIWFNEDPISADDAAAFQLSSYAGDSSGGKRRTMLQVMFCPGGGSATASPAAVKSIDLNTNHAKVVLAGLQTVVQAPKDFKVERMKGDIAPGGVLSGKIVGSHGKTSFNLDFELNLPQKGAAAGMSCGK